MNVNFDDFKGNLSQEEKGLLEKILQDETRRRRRELIEHYERDQKHLEIVNFCANFFTFGQTLEKETGYVLALVEPLYSIGVKNFDLGFFRSQNSSLILTECKSSVSDFSRLANDMNDAIRVTNERKPDIENALGNKISDPIEFALCLPAVEANDAYKQVVKMQIPVCIWAASQFDGKMKYFTTSEDTAAEIQAGRLHRDGNLDSLLGRGLVSKERAIRPISILPSSHICTQLVHVSGLIYRESLLKSKYCEFQYSDIFAILDNELGRMTGLSDGDFEKLATSILEVGLRKGIFVDLNPDVPEIARKIFDISGRKTHFDVIKRNIEENYVEHNAMEKAKSDAIDQFRKQTGATTLNSFRS